MLHAMSRGFAEHTRECPETKGNRMQHAKRYKALTATTTTP